MSSDGKVARLTNGIITQYTFKEDFSAVENTELPKEVSCKTKKIAIDSGKFDAKMCKVASLDSGEIKCPVTIESDLILQKATTAETTDEKLKCNFTANWTLDPKSRKLTGAGEIDSCDVLNYNCSHNDMRVRCQDLQKALKTYACD